MSNFRSDNVPDPLRDKFLLSDLPKIAPWVSEEIGKVGADRIFADLAKRGFDGHEPQAMTNWVSALSACHSDLWVALAAG
jgi:hypothetical protein